MTYCLKKKITRHNLALPVAFYSRRLTRLLFHSVPVITQDPLYLSAGHLFHKFGISESDWYRIKQSIDSKCRTAWRRKQRGQSLAVKSFSKRTPRTSGPKTCITSSDDSFCSDQDVLKCSSNHVTKHICKLECFCFSYLSPEACHVARCGCIWTIFTFE